MLDGREWLVHASAALPWGSDPS